MLLLLLIFTWNLVNAEEEISRNERSYEVEKVERSFPELPEVLSLPAVSAVPVSTEVSKVTEITAFPEVPYIIENLKVQNIKSGVTKTPVIPVVSARSEVPEMTEVPAVPAHIEVRTLSSHQKLPVPEDVKEYFKEIVGRGRQGRQIVPGVYSCGHQGGDMFINMINPHYPAHDRVAGTCQFRLQIQDPNVCQVRVDFVDTEMLSPTDGDCRDQYLVVTGSMWPSGFHRLCGINPDQHFYLHMNKEDKQQQLEFTVTSVTSGNPYKFGLWITQIGCGLDSSVKAPAGCTQYHFSPQGSIKSFNFEGVQYINNQNYKMCIKSEDGACHGEFKADTNQFMLQPVNQKKDNQAVSSYNRKRGSATLPSSMAGDEGCARDYILIPGGTSATAHNTSVISRDRYCGGCLNPKKEEIQGASVFTRISSNVFWIQFVSGRPNPGDFDNSIHGPGYRLRYFQIKCADSDAFN